MSQNEPEVIGESPARSLRSAKDCNRKSHLAAVGTHVIAPDSRDVVVIREPPQRKRAQIQHLVCGVLAVLAARQPLVCWMLGDGVVEPAIKYHLIHSHHLMLTTPLQGREMPLREESAMIYSKRFEESAIIDY